MKITIWLAARDRWTWIAGAETLGLALILVIGIDSWMVRLLGVALLAHLGYSAVTSLPMGEVPRRPPTGQHRRNLELRASVTTFLREVRRLEEYAQRARLSGWSRTEIEANLDAAERKMAAVASEVAKTARRTAYQPPDEGALPESRPTFTVHARATEA